MNLLDSTELIESFSGAQPDKPDEDIITRFRTDESLDFPIELTDLDIWANYTNDDLYFIDKKIREFFKKTRYKREQKGGYRTTASAMFSWIFGRLPEPADGYVFRIIHELLKYYCTSYTGQTTYKSKKVNRVYKFSRYATIKKRPYSLRLRLEEADGDSSALFRKGPNSDRDKRVYRGQKNRNDGEQASS